MTGKKLIRNLKHYIESNITDVPVYLFDINQEKTLPCIVVGYDSETTSFAGNNHGHFTVNGFTTIEYQGYEDPTTDFGDNTANRVRTLLYTSLSALNKPLSGTDTRPVSGFGINALIQRGMDTEIDGDSNTIKINFDAFCVETDF